jgi:hypothetical protein
VKHFIPTKQKFLSSFIFYPLPHPVVIYTEGTSESGVCFLLVLLTIRTNEYINSGLLNVTPVVLWKVAKELKVAHEKKFC